MKRANRLLMLGAVCLAIILFGSYSLYSKRSKYTISHLQKADNLVPVVIIGSGPAGLSAALYCARAHYTTLVLSGDFGGQLAGVKYIENWPGRKPSTGLEVMEDMKKQAESFGTQIVDEKVTTLDVSRWPFVIKTDNNQTISACAIILAMGGIAKRLNVPGVQEYWGKGVGSCTICEAPFYKDKEAAVVGGGDTAGDRALQLAAFAKVVYMIVREPYLDAVGAVQANLKKASNIKILYDTELEKVSGDSKWVTGIEIRNKKTGTTQQLPVSGIYFAIGYHPNSELVKNFIRLDSEGFIVVKGTSQETSIPGIFAAGNVATSDKAYGKAGVAIGSGVKAALDALTFCNKIGLTADVLSSLQTKFFNMQTHT
jgi:thioredoxin reductase (NADPH)